MGFTNRGGGKLVKSVPLAVLERHYRIHVLHNAHKDDVDWDDVVVMRHDEEAGTTTEADMDVDDVPHQCPDDVDDVPHQPHQQSTNDEAATSKTQSMNFGLALEKLKQETGTLDMTWTKELRQKKRCSDDSKTSDDKDIQLKRPRRKDAVTG